MEEGEGVLVQMGGLGAEMFKDCTVLQQRWLSDYCVHGDAIIASENTDTPHLEAMMWLRDDADFIDAFNMARQVVGMMLEARAIKRTKGEDASDRLTELLLKAMLPDKYDQNYKPEEEEKDYNGSFTNKIDVGEPEDEAI